MNSEHNSIEDGEIREPEGNTQVTEPSAVGVGVGGNVAVDDALDLELAAGASVDAAELDIGDDEDEDMSAPIGAAELPLRTTPMEDEEWARTAAEIYREYKEQHPRATELDVELAVANEYKAQNVQARLDSARIKKVRGLR